MEMEQINDNTIRVLIDNDDLEERGITVLDLLGSQNQIESFFYSILEEVDIDDSFKENDMITFQVVPNKTGLELYISKDNNIDPSLYTRNESNQNKYRKPQTDYHSFLADGNDEDVFDNPFGKNPFIVDDGKIESVYEFENFEQVIAFSKQVYLMDGISYLHEMNGKYYMTLVQFTDQTDELQIEMERGMALEFAEESEESFDVIQEHGNELMTGNALQEVRGYFG